MAYFKLLVIIFSLFLNLKAISKEAEINLDNLYLSKDDLKIFQQAH